MILADTTRSKAYIQALIRNNMLPNYVLMLENMEDVSMPGQLKSLMGGVLNNDSDGNSCWSEANFNPNTSLRTLLDEAKVPYTVTPNKDINSQEVIDLISSRTESVFIFSGFGGVLLRKNILASGKRFLHVHGGYLPKYKGSTTNYFSLIMDNKMGASSIFLTAEIDCGPVLFRQEFPAPQKREDIDHVFDSAARAKVLIETLQSYIQLGDWSFELESNKGGETYYVIHPVLKHIAILSGD